MGKVVAITGYKPYELGIFGTDHPGIHYIQTAIRRRLVELLDEGYEWVLISGQQGTELWAAETVFDLQAEYPELKLAVLMPFEGQEEKWKDEQKAYYEMVLSQADFVAAISKRPYESPQQFRNKNRIFLHKSDCLMVVYDEEREGSPKYLFEAAKKFSESHPYDIRIIDFYDLQAIIEEEQTDF
ncbi:UNVERIFIED_ORG: putative phage-like protein YoqJ [Heyndrickxia coagulans]